MEILNFHQCYLVVQDGEESQKDKDEKEELDFMFDEEIDSFGGGGRKNNFSEWLVDFLVLLKYPGPETTKKHFHTHLI